VDPAQRLTLTLGAVAAAVFAAAWTVALVRRWRRRDPLEIERQRRLEVSRHGRITNGQILDLVEPAAGEAGPRLVLYKYEVAGAAYEAAQDLTTLPEVARQVRWVAGRPASVKYDPHRPTNSILVCEEWSGIPEFESSAAVRNPLVTPPRVWEKT
jgi:hypothetical protein